MASALPRGALKRPADTQDLFKTGCLSAFLTHFLVSADDFNHRLGHLTRLERRSIIYLHVGRSGQR
jgi:hypothetical protein